MRQVRKTGQQEQTVLDYSPIALGPLADFLNRPSIEKGGLHIENVYFAKDGKYYFQAFPMNGKFYSRIEKENVFDAKLGKTVRKMVDKPEREIDRTMTAEDIIELVFEWRDKFGKFVKIIDEDGNKQMAWVVDEEKSANAKEPKTKKTANKA